MSALFVGDRSGLEKFLQSRSDRFYVYLLCRPDKTPFYVGKGLGRRVFQHESEARQSHPLGETNPHKCNVIRKLDRSGERIVYLIDSTYSTNDEQACLVREAELIQKFGRLHEGGPLTNLAGGIGSNSGASPFSNRKHRATLAGEPINNPERAILNRFLQSIGPVASVPIKPINQIARILPTKPHTQPRKPTQRCAYALLASACAHGLRLEPGIEIPRSFIFEGVEGVIENGVARDILKAGMAELIDADDKPASCERFRLNSEQCRLFEDLVGQDSLLSRGLI